MSRQGRAFPAAFLLLVSSAVLSGATITTAPVTYTLTGQYSYYNNNDGKHELYTVSGQGVDYFNVRQFDPSLGVLTDVLVTMTGSVQLKYKITDNWGGDTYAVDPSIAMTLSNPILYGEAAIQSIWTYQDSPVRLAAGQTYESCLLESTGPTGSHTIWFSPYVKAFTGTGLTSLRLLTIVNWRTNQGAYGVLGAATASSYTSNLQVSDVYTVPDSAVPEPQTIATMIGGFGCLALAAWRRKRAVLN